MGDREKWTNGKFRKFIRKLETQTLGGVGNLKFFCTINIKEMAAILQFFHNGWCWYSVSINTWKTGDPNFGGSVIWNFSVRSILKKLQPFFNFFIMADADIPFPLTLGKPETQTWGVSNLKFFHMINIKKWQPFFNFFIMADADIPSTLGKPEMFSFPNFQLVQFSLSPILGSVTTLMHGYT